MSDDLVNSGYLCSLILLQPMARQVSDYLPSAVPPHPSQSLALAAVINKLQSPLKSRKTTGGLAWPQGQWDRFGLVFN